MTDVASLLTIILFLTIVTNIIVEVLKSVLGKTVPWNLLALVVALIVTFLAFVATVTYHRILIEAWMVICAIAVAFVVAFSAMFGFDKLKEMIAQWTAIKNENDFGGNKKGD